MSAIPSRRRRKRGRKKCGREKRLKCLREKDMRREIDKAKARRGGVLLRSQAREPSSFFSLHERWRNFSSCLSSAVYLLLSPLLLLVVQSFLRSPLRLALFFFLERARRLRKQEKERKKERTRKARRKSRCNGLTLSCLILYIHKSREMPVEKRKPRRER